MEDRLTFRHRAAAHGSRDDRESGIALGGLIALFAITGAWWALALWPAADAPEWLTRTRYVCFNTGEDGLPDAGGWIGLIGGPIGMLAILLAGWHRGVLSLVRRARTSAVVSTVLAALACGTALLVAAAAVIALRAVGAAGLPAAAVPDVRIIDEPAPPLALLAHDGVVRDILELRGRPVLVTFAYAHCETVCPLIVRDVMAAREKLVAQGVPTTSVPRILVVTVDPWRDSPSRLAPMAASWRLPLRDAWVLGGEVPAVEAALDAWRVPRSRNRTTGEITHPALVYVVDRDGRIAFASSGGPDTLAELVRRL